MLKTFIIRGFYNTLDILKGEFLKTLNNYELLEKFIKFLVNANDQRIMQSEDMASTNLLEQRTDMLRTRVMGQLQMSLIETKYDRLVKLRIGEDVIYTEYEQDYWSFRIVR